MRRFATVSLPDRDIQRADTDIVGTYRVAENLEYTAVWNSAMLQTQVRVRSASSATSSWCFECNAQTPRANFDTVFWRTGYSGCLLGDAEEAEAEVWTDAPQAVAPPLVLLYVLLLGP